LTKDKKEMEDMMKKNRFAYASSLFILLFLVYAGHVQGETKGVNASLRFRGEVKGIDCATGELKVLSENGKEDVFYLGKEVKFRNIKGCGDIVVGGKVFIHYTETEGKKTVSSLVFLQGMDIQNQVTRRSGGAPSANAPRLIIGSVVNIECEKNVVSLEDMGDKGKSVDFSISKNTEFELPLKGCSDISKPSILIILYEEGGGKRIAKKIKLAKKEGIK